MACRPVLVGVLAVLLTSACGSSAAAPLGDADDVIPEDGSVSPLDTSHAAIRNLDPALLAVDLGPTDADDWIGRHGAEYGLCQAYANEMRHFESLTEPGGECPPPLPDAAG